MRQGITIYLFFLAAVCIGLYIWQWTSRPPLVEALRKAYIEDEFGSISAFRRPARAKSISAHRQRLEWELNWVDTTMSLLGWGAFLFVFAGVIVRVMDPERRKRSIYRRVKGVDEEPTFPSPSDPEAADE